MDPRALAGAVTIGVWCGLAASSSADRALRLGGYLQGGMLLFLMIAAFGMGQTDVGALMVTAVVATMVAAAGERRVSLNVVAALSFAVATALMLARMPNKVGVPSIAPLLLVNLLLAMLAGLEPKLRRRAA